MNGWDKFLKSFSQTWADFVGEDTVQYSNKVLDKTWEELKKGFSNVDFSRVNRNIDKIISPQSAQRAVNDFKEGVVGTLKPKGVAILMGAILGGGGAVVYNAIKNRKYNKEYERAPQLKWAGNVGRLYSGAILGGLAGLLLNKYRNKLQNAAANWFTKHKEYL